MLPPKIEFLIFGAWIGERKKPPVGWRFAWHSVIIFYRFEAVLSIKAALSLSVFQISTALAMIFSGVEQSASVGTTTKTPPGVGRVLLSAFA